MQRKAQKKDGAWDIGGSYKHILVELREVTDRWDLDIAVTTRVSFQAEGSSLLGTIFGVCSKWYLVQGLPGSLQEPHPLRWG